MDLNTTIKEIKQLKIQGARNIAIAALKAYSKNKTDEAVKKLVNARPTEPTLLNSLKYAKLYGVKKALKHFNSSQKKISKLGAKKIHGIVFTHCHSSSVVEILKQAKKEKKHFQVFNTETRPLYQGHKTSMELAKAKIKVTTIVDSAGGDVLDKKPVLEPASLVLLGADAITADIKKNKLTGVINKIGSGMFAEIAYNNKIPVYIASDSWKFSPRKVKIEFRNYKEVWNVHDHIKILNPAFEIIKPKYITAIISELGILSPKEFVKKVKQAYPFLNK